MINMLGYSLFNVLRFCASNAFQSFIKAATGDNNKKDRMKKEGLTFRDIRRASSNTNKVLKRPRSLSTCWLI